MKRRVDFLATASESSNAARLLADRIDRGREMERSKARQAEEHMAMMMQQGQQRQQAYVYGTHKRRERHKHRPNRPSASNAHAHSAYATSISKGGEAYKGSGPGTNMMFMPGLMASMNAVSDKQYTRFPDITHV